VEAAAGKSEDSDPKNRPSDQSSLDLRLRGRVPMAATSPASFHRANFAL
jgi:hypothetical protein